MNFLRKNFKRFAVAGLCALALAVATIGIPHWMVSGYSSDVHDAVSDVPAIRFGLLLGTAKYAYGLENRFYNNRMDAAAALYRAGKIEKVLVSGDHSKKTYNEPLDIQNDLVARGVDLTDIYLDYAGFSTLDSILRAKLVFGLERFVVISQGFQCERALYIAGSAGVDAVGFAARDVEGPIARKVYLREYLARVKVVIDVEFLGRQPKFLGENPYDFGS